MSKVYIVHCVDTEGPLNESIYATFDRLRALCGVNVEPTPDNLKRVQNKELDLNGYEDVMARVFSERIMAYNRDLTCLDQMLDKITSDEFRKKYLDSNGIGWKYTWFIMDHVDYLENPRAKITGYNSIWDHYKEYYRRNHIDNDEFQWHVHPANVYRDGSHSGVSYWNSPHVLESLAHRLIDRGFFPNAFRAGYHTERPDSHWLLEQYIPYDYTNQSVEEGELEEKQVDVSEGRFGDWRRARSDWGWYHPSHDDYQTEGNCHRFIFRCLNVGTRLRLLTQREVDKAFERASSGIDTVLAFCDHDFREMGFDIDEVYGMLNKSSLKYPGVKWLNSTASEAAKAVTCLKNEEMILEAEINRVSCDRAVLTIQSNIDSFGAQPFFALKMCGEVYRVEQLDVQVPNRKWSYVFDEESIMPRDIECLGVASNSRSASGALVVLSMDNDTVFKKQW